MTTRVVETKITYEDKPPCRTAAQMTAQCCEKTAALQCCEEVEKDWPGYSAKDIIEHLGITLDAQGRDSRGRYVNIELVPRSQPCGEKVIKYDLSQKNCCNGVAALVWDHDITPDVLPPGRSIIIGWTGSDGRQVEVTTTSNATFFSDGRKNAIGHGRSIELFAGETFCGSTAVTVSDGCSSATVMIRSTVGQWLFAGKGCVLSGSGVLASVDGSGNRGVEKISGNIKQVDYQKVRSSLEASKYFGLFRNEGTYIGCPQFNGSSCGLPIDANVSATHVACGNAAGFPVHTYPRCLADNFDGMSDPTLGSYEVRGGVYLIRGGAISYSCGNAYGGVSGTYLAALDSSLPPEYYRWSC